MRTISGTTHSNDGDIECIEVRRAIILIYGRLINVSGMAVSKFMNMVCCISVKRRGVVANVSTTISNCAVVKLVTTFKDFSGFNKMAHTDGGGKEHEMESACQNLIYEYIGIVVDRASLDDIDVIKLVITRSFKRFKVDGNVDKTSNRFVTVL